MGLITSVARSWLLRSFKPFQFTNSFDNELDYNTVPSLGLYVHIPFCKKTCSFCPYCKQLYEKDIATTYVEALLQEIDLVCAAQQEVREVTSLYFGGGSPALLVNDIARIISQLERYFSITDGIGVELHPDDVTVDVLQKLKQAGVTRISIGMQSFDKTTLGKLGRTETDYQGLFNAVHAVLFDTVAMDFIFALDGQTFDSVRDDIDIAFANGANHIALYPFIDFAFADSGIRKMGRKNMKRLLYQISHYCEEQGYVRDSIWTFGKPGVGKYSSMTRDNYLGFGCSATTLLEDQFKINTFSTNAYIERIRSKMLPTALTIHFTKRQRMIYWTFWRLYTMRLSSGDFQNTFDTSVNRVYGFELWLGRLFGLLKRTGDGHELTPRGVFFYHYFEGYYTLSYINKMWHIMNKEDFPRALVL